MEVIRELSVKETFVGSSNRKRGERDREREREREREGERERGRERETENERKQQQHRENVGEAFARIVIPNRKLSRLQEEKMKKTKIIKC